MSERQPSKSSSFVDEVIDIVPAICIGAVTAWGTHLTWMKCSMSQTWLAKGFYGFFAGMLALSTVFIVAIVVIFLVEFIKDWASRSKE